MMTSAILISTSENSTTLWICELRCITVTENNISQMVKIEESENFHRRRRMTSSLKMATFLEKIFCQKAPHPPPSGIGFNLAPKLLDLDFVRSSLTVTAQKANTCSPWTPCFDLFF